MCTCVPHVAWVLWHGYADLHASRMGLLDSRDMTPTRECVALKLLCLMAVLLMEGVSDAALRLMRARRCCLQELCARKLRWRAGYVIMLEICVCVWDLQRLVAVFVCGTGAV